MKKFNRIAVVDGLNSNIMDFAKEEISKFSEAPVNFPSDYPTSDNEIVKRIGDADCVLLSWQTKLTAGILDRCPNIRYVGLAATTLANLPVDELAKRGIVLKNVCNYSGEATAEYIFAQLLILARGLNGMRWKDEPCDLDGKTLGVIGLGDVGSKVAERALGFGMNVLYYQRKRNAEFDMKGLKYTELKELLKKSDIITVHLPTNTKMLGKEEFGLIPEGTVLVNTTLGKVFEPEDFLEWIGKGKNYAIFDADAETEKIRHAKNVIIGTQEAGRTTDAQARLSRKFVVNLKSYLEAT